MEKRAKNCEILFLAHFPQPPFSHECSRCIFACFEALSHVGPSNGHVKLLLWTGSHHGTVNHKKAVSVSLVINQGVWEIPKLIRGPRGLMEPPGFSMLGGYGFLFPANGDKKGWWRSPHPCDSARARKKHLPKDLVRLSDAQDAHLRSKGDRWETHLFLHVSRLTINNWDLTWFKHLKMCVYIYIYCSQQLNYRLGDWLMGKWVDGCMINDW